MRVESSARPFAVLRRMMVCGNLALEYLLHKQRKVYGLVLGILQAGQQQHGGQLSKALCRPEQASTDVRP